MKVQINKEEIYEIKLPESVTTKEQLDYVINRLQQISKLSDEQEQPFSVEQINDNGNHPINLRNHLNYPTIIPIRKNGNYNPYDGFSNKKYARHTFFDTREKAIYILQLHYHGTQEQRMRIIEKMNIKGGWNEFSKGFWGIRHKYNMQPKELGLIRIPQKGEGGKKRKFQDFWISICRKRYISKKCV